MLDLAKYKTEINSAKELVYNHKERIRSFDDMATRINTIKTELLADLDTLDVYIRAAVLIGTVADETTKATLSKLTSIINKALDLIFPYNKRWVEIEQVMYRNKYPHFNLILYVDNGAVRSFKQSGTGLAQTISFLYTICLIDARKCRRIFVMDELLSGLHPDAKELIKDIMSAVAKNFQIIVTEYNLDIGKQYLVENKDSVAEMKEYKGSHYYRDLVLAKVKQLEADAEYNS